MNGGPTSPPEYHYFVCDNLKCLSQVDEEADLAPSCEHPGCMNWVLCVGCSYDCFDCLRSICEAHVCETPLPDRMAIYRCCRCQDFSEQYPGLYALFVSAALLDERAA